MVEAEEQHPKPRKLERQYSPEQADLIRSLQEHPGFQFLWGELRKRRIIALNNCLDKERGLYELGVHDGLMRAINYPKWIIADTIEDPDVRLRAMPSEFVSEEDIP